MLFSFHNVMPLTSLLPCVCGLFSTTVSVSILPLVTHVVLVVGIVHINCLVCEAFLLSNTSSQSLPSLHCLLHTPSPLPSIRYVVRFFSWLSHMFLFPYVCPSRLRQLTTQFCAVVSPFKIFSRSRHSCSCSFCRLSSCLYSLSIVIC